MKRCYKGALGESEKENGYGYGERQDVLMLLKKGGIQGRQLFVFTAAGVIGEQKIQRLGAKKSGDGVSLCSTQ